jgi:hypothetical protein
MVTVRVNALVGLHAVEHHAVIPATPSMLESVEVGPFPQQ